MSKAGAYVTSIALLEEAGTTSCGYALQNRDAFNVDAATQDVINSLPHQFRAEVQASQMAEYSRRGARATVAEGIAKTENKISQGADRNTACGLFIGGLLGLYTAAKSDWASARSTLTN